MLNQVFANSDIVLSLYYLVLFGKLLPISFVAAHHHGRRGVIPTRGESLLP